VDEKTQEAAGAVHDARSACTWTETLRAAVVLAGYSGLAFALFHRAWADPGRRLVGTCCDSSAYVDTFRFTGTSVAHLQSPFFTNLVNAPHGVNVMWQPNVLPVVGFVASPFETLVGPMVTYDLVVTMAVALSCFGAYLALRRWVGGLVGPVVGGLVFGFSPVETGHSLGHPQVTCALLLPLVLLMTTDVLVEQRFRWWTSGAALGALLAVELLVGEEMFAGVVITGAVIAVIIAARFRRQIRSHLMHVVAAASAAAVTFGALGAWPLYVQFAGPERLKGPVHQTGIYATNLAGYVIPVPLTTELSTSWTVHSAFAWFRNTGFSEANAYLGLPLLLLLVVTVVVLRRSPLIQVTSIATLVMAVLSLGTELHVAGHTYNVWLPWRLLHELPLVSSLQANRLAMFVDLGVATIVAEALRRTAAAARRRSPSGEHSESSHFDARRVGAIVGLAAITLALVPLLPSLHYPDYRPTVPSFFTTSDVNVIAKGGTVLLVPFPRGSRGDDADMIWQAEADLRFKIVGGGVYVPGPGGKGTTFGGAPTILTYVLGVTEHRGTAPAQTPGVLLAERRNLVSWKVDDVVVGPMSNEERAVSVLETVLGEDPVRQGDVFYWVKVDHYPVIEQAAAQPS
jgi:hypothetical protein